MFQFTVNGCQIWCESVIINYTYTIYSAKRNSENNSNKISNKDCSENGEVTYKIYKQIEKEVR